MPYINYMANEISFKIVYYGPGMSGKTTNLTYIYRTLSDNDIIKGEMIMLDTAEERTLFFDFFPLDIGTIEGFKLRFNMYTVPGQIFYHACRRLILEGADGIVFVADSQFSRFDDNIESWQGLVSNLESYGVTIKNFPIVLQYNKRDLNSKIEVGSLEKALGLNGIPVFESIATQGTGVMATIREISKMLLQRFQI